MNHLQLIILTASFDFDWPNKVLDIFETAEPAAEVSSQILSVDCFLDSRSEDNDSNPIRLFYQKMIIYALLPILLFLGSITFWYIYYSIYKDQVEKRAGRIAATVIILLFLVHPTIVQYMFSNFNCLDIDEDQRIYDDLEVVCWNAEHINYSLMIAVPSIVIWGFGIPFFAWVILARNKEDLDAIDTREKYGFLYNGYKKQYYFWETVNMYRKISIIFVSVFLKLAGVITQALVIFLVLIFFLILNIKLLPFAFNSLNDMEMMSLITSMLTIYCGLFYLSHNPEVYNSDDTSVQSADNGLRLSEGSKWLFFIIILGCNILFLAYWCYKMLKELENTIMTKFEKVYLYICLCGNKNKLENQKRRRKIQDENEILKEQFDTQLSQISNLYREGKLILNKLTIQKSAIYLNPETYLRNIKAYEAMTQEELRKKKIFMRKRVANNMRDNFNNQIDVELDELSRVGVFSNDAAIIGSKENRGNNLQEENKRRLESDPVLNDFLQLEKQDEVSQVNSQIKMQKDDYNHFQKNAMMLSQSFKSSEKNDIYNQNEMTEFNLAETAEL